MPNLILTVFLVLCSMNSLAASQPIHSYILDHFAKSALRFEVNQGQADSRVQFLCRVNGRTILLTNGEAVFPAGESEIRMRLIRTASNAKVEGIDRLPGITNYIRGTDTKRWQTNITSYAKVVYRDVYAGIDLVYYGNRGELEYDFLVSAGTDPGSIQLAFDGVRNTGISDSGDLLLFTNDGKVIQRKPVVWQLSKGTRKQIDARYVIRGPRQVGFEFKGYDPSLAMVIDPVVTYATYLGGRDRDQIFTIAAGPNGDVYVAGVVSGRFPVTPDASQSVPGGGQSDVFVARLNADGSNLTYATYLGGSSSETATGIAVDPEGNAYILGSTNSTDFPTTADAFQTQSGGSTDAFVTKLSPSGAVVYSTYLGGTGPEVGGFGLTGGRGMAVDSAGYAYVTGPKLPCPSNFPITPGVFRTPSRCSGFLTKLNQSGTGLVYSTDFGGRHIAIDPDGNVYVAGYAGDRYSADSPYLPVTPDAYRVTCRNKDYLSTGDSFVAKIDRSGSTLIYSTCFAGDITGLAVDSAGNAYVTGTTNSSDFETTPGSYRTEGNRDCDADGWGSGLGNPTGGECELFLTKLNSTGTGLVYSTYLFGSRPGLTFPNLALDSAGNAYVSGFTDSWNDDTRLTPFLMKVDATGASLIDATRVPSIPLSLAVDAEGNAYLGGWSAQEDGSATAGAFQTSLAGGGADGFIIKIRLR